MPRWRMPCSKCGLNPPRPRASLLSTLPCRVHAHHPTVRHPAGQPTSRSSPFVDQRHHSVLDRRTPGRLITYPSLSIRIGYGSAPNSIPRYRPPSAKRSLPGATKKSIS